MKYPITPDFLENAPGYLVQLQRDLERDVISDICRRMKLSGEMTESAIHQIMILQRQGLDLKDVEKRIAATSKQSQKKIDELFDRAVQCNQEYYDHTISKADIFPPVDAAQRLATQAEAIRRQTLDEFNNITRSMGFVVNVGGKTQFLPIAKAYQQTLDNALMKVSSGAFDYNTAIKGAVDELANSGLRYIDYASGWHNRIEVATRRAVMTGVSQVSGRYSEQTAQDLGTDIVEVTAHGGARDTGKGFLNHKLWQGLLYSISGNSKKYPPLNEKTGYGSGGGLMGWNCRHAMFPFVDGVSERTYTDQQLKKIDAPPFTYQGKEYKAYEASQQQRRIETAIRDTKRKMVGYEAAGLTDDYSTSAIRLNRLQSEYKQFSTAAGLRTQPERYRMDGYGQKQTASSNQVGNVIKSYQKLNGLTAANGIKMTATDHLGERAVQRGVPSSNVKEAILHPLKITDTKVDAKGRASVQYVGEFATVAVNPETGMITTVFPTHAKTAKKLKGGST